MIVGGNDIIIDAPPDTPVTEPILLYVRRFWPDSWFQDAEDDRTFSIHDRCIMVRGTLSTEFFVYRNHAAVEAWDRNGGTPENLNDMLYFIIGAPPKVQTDPRQFTLVCGEITEEIERLVDSLEKSLRSSWFPARVA